MIELRTDIFYKMEIVNGKNDETRQHSTYYTAKILEQDEFMIKIQTIKDEILVINKSNITRMIEVEDLEQWYKNRKPVNKNESDKN